MQDRLQELIALLKLTPAQFAERLSINRATVSHLLSGRNKPSVGLLQDLAEQFTDVNIEWLVTGKGAALKTQSPPPQKPSPQPDPSPTIAPEPERTAAPLPSLSTTSSSAPIVKVLVIRQDGSIEEYGQAHLRG